MLKHAVCRPLVAICQLELYTNIWIWVWNSRILNVDQNGRIMFKLAAGRAPHVAAVSAAHLAPILK